MSRSSSLRVVTYRLNTTPVKELPHIAHFLASSIQNCSDALKSASGQSSGKIDDLSLQVHKLKAKLGSLLQDRSPEGRFTAVVLVKATVEAGGRQILGSCEPWLRGLLAVLSRPDPVSSKRLCLLTITRIFSLVQQYPTLIREITTPLLPAFVTACMKLGALHPSPSDETQRSRPSPYLETVLQCMLHLIPDHPTTFRPFASKLHTALMKFIGGQSNSEQVTHLAQSVLVLLRFCAPKNTAGDEWLKACQAVVASIHGIADQIFRAVIEDWETSDGNRRQVGVPKTFVDVPHNADNDPLGLPPWQGVYPGSSVLVSVLHLLKTFVLGQTSQIVGLPVGLILDLTSRLLYIRVPADSKESPASVRFNPEVGREERDELLAILPDIHHSALDLISSLVEVAGLSILPVSHVIVDQCLWVFGAESSNEGIRLASYELLNKVMPFTGPSVTKDSCKPLSRMIDFCCKDISGSFEDELRVQSQAGSNSKTAVNGHADSFLQTSSKKIPKSQPQSSALQTVASSLLCHILEFIPAQAIPHSLRAQIDRTAILNDQKRLLLASVLNPAPKVTGKHAPPSVMPFLARTSLDDLAVEGLLRPRMPVVQQEKTSPYYDEEDSEEDIGKKISNHHKRAEETGTGTSTQPVVHGSGTQNDILDRFEDSIDDRKAPASNIAPSPATMANRPTLAPTLLEDDTSPTGIAFNQGPKRRFANVDVHEEDDASKRFRGSALDVEAHAVAALEADTVVASASTAPVIFDADSPVPVEAGVGAAVVDKGKGRATSVSPAPSDGLATFGNGNVEAEADDDDDESDFERPTLYLKTTDSENEEDDDEEDEMM